MKQTPVPLVSEESHKDSQLPIGFFKFEYTACVVAWMTTEELGLLTDLAIHHYHPPVIAAGLMEKEVAPSGFEAKRNGFLAVERRLASTTNEGRYRCVYGAEKIEVILRCLELAPGVPAYSGAATTSLVKSLRRRFLHLRASLVARETELNARESQYFPETR